MHRFFHLISALILLILLSPLILVISFVLVFQGPVIFQQQRIGKDNKSFKIYKFRTMVSERHIFDNSNLHSTKRITRFGKILRKFSLDELPQLWNIVKGEMVLVGPRPLPIAYLSKMNEMIKKRHTVYPGITGWAQVNGRNILTWKDKFNLDLWYIDNRNFLLDLKILYLSLVQIFKVSEINQDEYQTMEEFRG